MDFVPFPNQIVANKKHPRKENRTAHNSLAAGFKNETGSLTLEQPAFLQAVPILISSLSSSGNRSILQKIATEL